MLKKCCICKKEIPLEGFNKDLSKGDGLQSKCRNCQKEWKKNNRDKQRSYKIKHNAINEVKKKSPEIRHLESIANKELKLRIKKKRMSIIELFKKHFKYCNTCEQMLRRDEFNLSGEAGSGRGDGWSSRCKLCRREYVIKRRGKKRGMIETINHEDIWTIYKRFNFKCFNCNTNKELSIDHHINNIPLSHSNAVILCKPCNSLKHIKDPKIFYSAEKIQILNKLINSST